MWHKRIISIIIITEYESGDRLLLSQQQHFHWKLCLKEWYLTVRFWHWNGNTKKYWQFLYQWLYWENQWFLIKFKTCPSSYNTKLFNTWDDCLYKIFIEFLMGPGRVINSEGIPGDDLIVGNWLIIGLSPLHHPPNRKTYIFSLPYYGSHKEILFGRRPSEIWIWVNRQGDKPRDLVLFLFLNTFQKWTASWIVDDDTARVTIQGIWSFSCF